MEVHKITPKIENGDWHQIEKYLIATDLERFKAHCVRIIEDDDTVKAIKQIVDKDSDHKSFIAIELN